MKAVMARTFGFTGPAAPSDGAATRTRRISASRSRFKRFIALAYDGAAPAQQESCHSALAASATTARAKNTPGFAAAEEAKSRSVISSDSKGASKCGIMRRASGFDGVERSQAGSTGRTHAWKTRRLKSSGD